MNSDFMLGALCLLVTLLLYFFNKPRFMKIWPLSASTGFR